MLEPAIQDSRRWWRREDILLLLLLGALFFLPGLKEITLFDRDEPRFATAAREMLQSGDYIVPRFNGHLRPDKPPLVYWLMTLSSRAVGGMNELGARLPSAVCGTLTLIVVYLMTGARFGRLTGLLAALILGSSSLFLVESRMATADATMMLFIVICMACAWQAWDRGVKPEARSQKPEEGARVSWVVALLFWVSLAAGVLTKGVPLFFVLVPMVILSLATGSLPQQLKQWRSHLHVTGMRIGIAIVVGVMVVVFVAGAMRVGALEDVRWWAAVVGALLAGMVLTPGLPGVLIHCVAGANWRWWRGLKPMVGIPLLIALVGWWVVAAWNGTDPRGELIVQMVGVHFFERIGAGPLLKWLGIQLVDMPKPGGNDSMSHYGKPPGMYLALVWLTFWPWSVLIVPTAYHAVRRVLGRTAIVMDRRPYQFLVAWIVPMWIALEVARGKLLHYPLPLYVGIAILCADALVQGWHRMTEVFAAKWFAGARWLMLLIWVGMGAAVLAGAKWTGDEDLFWRCIPLAGAFAAAGVAATIAWDRPSWPFVTALGWAGALLVMDTLVLPEIHAIDVTRVVGREMAQMRREDPELHFARQGYPYRVQADGTSKKVGPLEDEGTLVFYAGDKIEDYPRVREGQPDLDLAEVLKGPTKYVAAVDEPTEKKLLEKGVVFYRVMERRGVDAANQQVDTVILITNVPPKGPATTRGEAATR